MENNEIMNIDNGNEIEIAQDNKKELVAVKTETMADKKKLYNALEKCDAMVNDSEGQEVNLVGVYMSEFMKDKKDENDVVELDAEGNPVRVKGHWTLLFDQSGKTYGSASNVFYYAVLRLLKSFGDPTKWEEPLKIEITKTQMKGAKGKASTFKLV